MRSLAQKEADKRYRQKPEIKYRQCEAVKKYNKTEKGIITRKKTEYKQNYDITLEQYEIMYNTQDGLCAICKTKPTRSLHIDHCHITGKVRGLLCSNCNTGLGLFKDNTDSLMNALAYLNGKETHS